MNFKNINEIAYFTAETVIHREFENTKSFPKQWDYLLTEEEIKHIPQEDLRDEIMNDIPKFNDTVIHMIYRKLEWLMAEGFTVDDGDEYRFLSDQEMKEEVDKIMAE
jgi:hypothetical protein